MSSATEHRSIQRIAPLRSRQYSAGQEILCSVGTTGSLQSTQKLANLS